MGLGRLIYLGTFSIVMAVMLALTGCGNSSAPSESETTQGGGEETSASAGTTSNPETSNSETTGAGETTEATGGSTGPVAGTTSEETTAQETTASSESTSGEDTSEQAAAQKKPADGNAVAVPDTLAPGVGDATNGPLVDHRLVSYYGHPWSAQMGVLGEYQDPQQMVDALKEQAAAYTAADPDLPAIPTIELIASVAQPTPGPDGLYLNRTPPEVIEEYAQLAKANDVLLLLDVQIGYSTVAAEVEALRPFLERPYVHLAIDPEYDMAPGEVPGQQFGSTPAWEIKDAAETLSTIVQQNELPPKVMVIHQFRYDMIENKAAITPTPNVQTVLHADGFGAPATKINKYNLLVRDEPIQYGGFKLFYSQDVPLMSPEEVLSLNPPPAVVSYQ